MGSYFIFKFVALVFLIWKCYPDDYKCDFDIALEKISKDDKILDIGFKRSLAKHEFRNKLEQSGLREELKDYRNYKMKKHSEDISAYGDLKSGSSNELYTYKKGYKHRYGKKRGLAKLECYCEKKIFDEIDYIHELALKMKNDKKSLKKKIRNKYGIKFIMLGLLPIIGCVLPILFWSSNEGKALINFCIHESEPSKTTHSDNEKCKNAYIISKDTGEIFKSIYLANDIILNYIFPILILLIFIYIIIKIVKYKLLKSGKNKINRKDYINFCKELFKKY
ncbi:hypothetical protein PVNG_04462 [Plasmodium vivax North Korean]|uniref:Variable surface protein Vir35 n=1 Tax=Plasmodium vivax North Korean TaxID=1035514 RepID=A0A0J9U1X1_PLAVI|nr:hypothetical protein PVNG_04462 [Plasmodium vivax North Korean]